jgi:hypothetical protein
MSYLLTCKDCNTNLEYFNPYDGNLHCNCPPNSKHSICNGIYISYYFYSKNNFSINVDFCKLQEEFVFNSNIIRIFVRSEIYEFKYDNIFLEQKNLEDKELIDYGYNLFLKYKKNILFY